MEDRGSKNKAKKRNTCQKVTMPRREPKHITRLKQQVPEQFRIQTEEIVRKFLEDSDQAVYKFPPTLSPVQRAYIHQHVLRLGLKSKSEGKEPNRILNIIKKANMANDKGSYLQLTPTTVTSIERLLKEFPLTSREVEAVIEQKNYNIACKTLVKIHDGNPSVPPDISTNEFAASRANLPVWEYRDYILQQIQQNQVVLISGDTGSGKSTQVPQFILEDANAKGVNCRMFCTQPRRLSAVAVAERVAAERGEQIGLTIGYQIRLESRISPRTVLTYCTNGVLLRSLMCGMACLKSLTHVIVDEVHERDRFSDFLLICLRECLIHNPNLKLILMSATADLALFKQYFQNKLVVINVPGRQFPVQELFLEDVLRMTNFMSNAMIRMMNGGKKITEEWVTKPPEIPVELDPQMATAVENSLFECWKTGTFDSFNQLMHLIMSEGVPVNYQHRDTGISPLMVAAAYGNVDFLYQFLNLGASMTLKSINNYTALDWARKQNHTPVIQILENFMEPDVNKDVDEHRLILYSQTQQDEMIDYNLIVEILLHFHLEGIPGSILVFLAGYDDIVTVRNMIQEESKFQKNGVSIVVHTLHSNMQTCNQKSVFAPAPPNTRKIILSTNIAETSITIEDVVYVVDSGKVKEKNFDAASNVCSLKSAWISRACARQRAGRAGRTAAGYCCHLFSRTRYAAMQAYSTPEILRMPLHELCLHTKMLAPVDMSIADFLGLAIEPPSAMVTRNAVEALKQLGALNNDESLTPLGLHLVELPIEPHLGKIVLHATILKCLDPILTIVASLAYRDPFILPALPNKRRQAQQSRIDLSNGTFSDHMALLKAFQLWQNKGSDRGLCDRNFISSATMEMIICFRMQILGQLRAAGFVRNRPPGDIKELNQFSNNWAVVKTALAAGMYPNIAVIDPHQRLLRTEREKKALLHPSSVLREPNLQFEFPQTDWVIFDELSRNSYLCHARGTTLVTSITILLFTGPQQITISKIPQEYESDSDSEDTNLVQISVNSWIKFNVPQPLAQKLIDFRLKWHSLANRRMQQPTKWMRPVDDILVGSIVDIVSVEDIAAGFIQPHGVGLRPKPYTPSNYRAPPQRVNSRDSDLDSNASSLFESIQRYGKEMSQMVSSFEHMSPNTSFENNGRLVSNVSETSFEVSRRRFFMIKVPYLHMIETSVTKKTWVFSAHLEPFFEKILRLGFEPLLIFTVNGSNHCQGIAELVSGPTWFRNQRHWGVNWISRGNLSFQRMRHLTNAYNNNRRVYSGPDGQEVDPVTGAAILELLTSLDPEVPQQMDAPSPPKHGRAIYGNRK